MVGKRQQESLLRKPNEPNRIILTFYKKKEMFLSQKIQTDEYCDELNLTNILNSRLNLKIYRTKNNDENEYF